MNTTEKKRKTISSRVRFHYDKRYLQRESIKLNRVVIAPCKNLEEAEI